MVSLAGAAFAESTPPLSAGRLRRFRIHFSRPPSPGGVPADSSALPDPVPFALPRLAPSQFRADASAPAAPTAPGLLGSWTCKARTCLATCGGCGPPWPSTASLLTILENVETFGNVSGGVKQSLEPKGLTTVTLQMDTEKAFGLKGGTLNVSGLQVYGGELNADNLMVLQTLSDIDAPVGIRLWELWYQQKFSDKFDVKIGEQSLDEEFIIAPTGNSLFINGVSGWPGLPTVDLPGGGPVYPLAALGDSRTGAADR